MYYTTLQKLRDHSACFDGYTKLVCALKGEEYSKSKISQYFEDTTVDLQSTIPLEFILHSNGVVDAAWALRTIHQTKELEDKERIFARACALEVAQLWKAPEIVLEYLRTGKKELRTSANSAAATAYAANSAAAYAANSADSAADSAASAASAAYAASANYAADSSAAAANSAAAAADVTKKEIITNINKCFIELFCS